MDLGMHGDERDVDRRSDRPISPHALEPGRVVDARGRLGVQGRRGQVPEPAHADLLPGRSGQTLSRQQPPAHDSVGRERLEREQHANVVLARPARARGPTTASHGRRQHAALFLALRSVAGQRRFHLQQFHEWSHAARVLFSLHGRTRGYNSFSSRCCFLN